MNKKIIALAMGLSLVLPFATKVNAAPIILKAATTASPDSYSVRAFTDMAKMVNEKTNGKYKLEIYDSGKLGNTESMVQGIQFGTIHFVQEGTGNMTAFTPIVGFFDLPFVFTDIEGFRKVFTGPMGQKIADVASNKTIKYLGFTECGFRKMWTRSPINTLEELRKARIRTTLSKTHNMSISAMGINATPMPMMEVFTGIQQGVVDGLDLDQVWSRTYNIHEVAPYVYESDHLLTPQPIVTGTRFWNKLSDEDRKVLQECVDYYKERANYHYQAMNDEARQWMLERKVTFVAPSAADKQAMIDAAKPLWDKLPADQAALLKEIQAYIAGK